MSSPMPAGATLPPTAPAADPYQSGTYEHAGKTQFTGSSCEDPFYVSPHEIRTALSTPGYTAPPLRRPPLLRLAKILTLISIFIIPLVPAALIVSGICLYLNLRKERHTLQQAVWTLVISASLMFFYSFMLVMLSR